MILILFDLIVALIMILEYRRTQMFVTPIITLGGIHIFLVTLINTIGLSFGFQIVSDKTILLFLMFICVMAFSGYFALDIRHVKPNAYVGSDVIENKLLRYEKIIFIIYLISLVSYIYNLFQVIRIYGIDNTKGHEFGIFAHIGMFSKILFPIIIFYFFKQKKLKYLIPLIVNILGLFIFKGKYQIFIPIVSCVIVLLFLKRNIKIKTVLITILISFILAILIFAAVYIIIPDLMNNSLNMSSLKAGIIFSVQHFFQYIFDPFICSNVFFENPAYNGYYNGFRYIFNPLDSLIQLITGSQDYYNPIINLWVIIDSRGIMGNVGGIFSESVLNIGYIFALLYIMFMTLYVYLIFGKTYCTGKYFLTTVFSLTLFSLSFFCDFFILFSNFECLVYCILIDLFVFNGNISYIKKEIRFSIRKNKLQL